MRRSLKKRDVLTTCGTESACADAYPSFTPRIGVFIMNIAPGRSGRMEITMKKQWSKTVSKFLACSLAAGALYTAPAVLAAEPVPTDITVWLNGTQIQSDVAPVSESDRTLVPFRAIFEAMGAEVSWDDTAQTASVTLGGITIKAAIDDPVLMKNGQAVQLDVPARLVNDRTMVPVRAISEGLGATVDWDEAAQQVLITYRSPSVTSTAAPVPTATTTPAPTASAGPGGSPESSKKPEITQNPQGILVQKDLEELSGMGDQLRYTFEQEFLLEEMQKNHDDFKTLLSSDLQQITDMLDAEWTILCNRVMINLLASSDHTYNLDKATAESLQKDLAISQEEAGLLFADFYAVSKEAVNGQNVILLTSKAPENLMLGTYGAIALDGRQLRIFVLEASFDGLYFFCEPTVEAHRNYNTCENTKEAFLEQLKDILKQ